MPLTVCNTAAPTGFLGLEFRFGTFDCHPSMMWMQSNEPHQPA